MIRSTTRALLVVYLACVAGTMLSAAPRFQIQTPSQAAPAVVYAAADDVPEPVRLETFRIVWDTVRDRYFDPTFAGVDWAAVRERYRPLVLATPKGRRIEGAGVVPDVAVELRQAELLVGKDTVVEKAIEVLTQACHVNGEVTRPARPPARAYSMVQSANVVASLTSTRRPTRIG